jgi:hypothetical protein
MKRQQPDVWQGGSSNHSFCNSVRDVVELEVQKDLDPLTRQLFDGSGTFGCKELAADLEETGHANKLARQGAGRLNAIKV